MARGSGFINWQDFVGANRAGAERLAGDLARGAEGEGEAARATLEGLQGRFSGGVGEGKRAAMEGGAQYTGPSSLADMEGFTEAQAAADKAARGSRRLANTYGRMGALGEAYGATPGYGLGARAFDSALAGSVGQRRFEANAERYGGLGSAYTDALRVSGDQADTARGEVRQHHQDVWDERQKKGEQAWADWVGQPSPQPRQPPTLSERQRRRRPLGGYEP